MGLLTLLRRLKKDDKEARILVLGLDNAGKVSVIIYPIFHVHKHIYYNEKCVKDIGSISSKNPKSFDSYISFSIYFYLYILCNE